MENVTICAVSMVTHSTMNTNLFRIINLTLEKVIMTVTMTVRNPFTKTPSSVTVRQMTQEHHRMNAVIVGDLLAKVSTSFSTREFTMEQGLTYAVNVVKLSPINSDLFSTFKYTLE